MGECTTMVYELRWMIILALILIISDLHFGLEVSRMKGLEIRKSRAGRRTLNKCIDYICYIVLGAVLGKAFGEPYGFNGKVIAITVMALCYYFEMDSIYGHICELHGIKKRYSILKILLKVLSFKFKDLGDSFESMAEQSRNFKKKQKK